MQHAHIGRRTLAVALLCGLGAGAAAAETGSAPLQIGSAQLAGDEASYLDLGLGSFGSGAGHLAPQSAEGRIELRYGRKLFYLGPALGLLANTKGGVFGYGGLYADVHLGDVVITPFGGIGGYDRGNGERLGGTFEFRLSLAAAYEFANRSRVGVQYAHISNASIHEINPGDNELLVTYSLPLSF
ncbi:MAG TPA: acyloxyacyl hydrolase [Stellaceae bacterium]|nr:acyloxyacyl hydrolase [Stellaceae bacterium]